MMVIIVEANASMTLRCSLCPTFAPDLERMAILPDIIERSTTHQREAHPNRAPHVAPDAAYEVKPGPLWGQGWEADL